MSKLALLDTSVWVRLRDGRLTVRAADRLYARLERGAAVLWTTADLLCSECRDPGLHVGERAAIIARRSGLRLPHVA